MNVEVCGSLFLKYVRWSIVTGCEASCKNDVLTVSLKTHLFSKMRIF